MDSSIMDGIGTAIIVLIIICVLIGIGLWELAQWLFDHISITWN